jgi:redox-sensitive bicupin YhaK (pirin superfamily)
MKKVLSIHSNDAPHWVGDGFPVRSIFNYNELGHAISPFLLMDYAGPVVFPPSEHIRGVGEHPHRGFETVTIIYSGEVEHRDSHGGGGLITPGDVQWMTAASGLVHEEKHGIQYAKSGGAFEMIQLWVNLPKKDKMSPPRYQGIPSDKIPEVMLADKAGSLRVIAGDFFKEHGPATTFTPINIWDMRLNPGHTVEFKVPSGHTAALFILSGSVLVNGNEIIGDAQMALLDPNGETFSLTIKEETKALFLGGKPISEPIVGYGPFVMNSPEEIRRAFRDFEEGRMGSIAVETKIN